MKFLTALLPFAKKLLFDEGVKIAKKKLLDGQEENKDHAKPEKVFNYKRALMHGGKKGLPVYLATVLAKIITIKFPELQLDPPILIGAISGLIFVVINILKKRFGLNLKGIL